MEVIRRSKLILTGSVLAVLLAGCVSTSAPTQSSPGAAAADPEPADALNGAVDSQAAVELSALDRVLAERRRGDFPEIQTQDYGFTITEQVRIGGASHSQYELATSLLQQQRYDEAISQLMELTAEAPEITAPFIDLGIAYGRTGQLERAAEALETASLLSPGHPIAHNELGIIYRQAGRFADARTEYEKALAVYPEFHFARRNLAVLCDLYLADIECALQNYQMYLDSVREDAEVEIWIADLARRSGQDL